MASASGNRKIVCIEKKGPVTAHELSKSSTNTYSIPQSLKIFNTFYMGNTAALPFSTCSAIHDIIPYIWYYLENLQ